MKAKLFLKPVIFMLILIFVLNFLEFLTANSSSYVRLMMHEMYHQNEPVDVVFIGASTIQRGFNPEIFDKRLNRNTFNMGSAYQDIVGTYYLLKEVYKYHTPEIVLIDINVRRLEPIEVNQQVSIIDYYRFSLDKLLFLKDGFEVSYYPRALFPATRESNIKVLSDFAAIKAKVSEKLTPEYWNYSYSTARHDSEWYQGKGYIQNNDHFPEVNKETPIKFKRENMDAQAIEFYEKVLRLCKEHNSIPILITMPRIESSYDVQGTIDFYDYVNQLAAKNDVDYYDFNLLKYFEKKEIYFSDIVHMNQQGAEKFDEILSGFLSDYLAQKLDTDDYLYDSYDELAKH